MHRHSSRLACGVSLIALLALAAPARAEIVTTGNASNPVNTAGNAASGFIALGPNGTGQMTVNGGSVLTMAPDASGAGQINLGGTQGTTVSVGTGTLTVQGVGARIDFTGPESILIGGRWGAASVGTINILEGGVIDMTAGFGIRLGRGNSNAGFGTDGATGLMRVDGPGSALVISGVDSLGAAPGIMLGRDQGYGQLTIANGGLVTLNTTATTSSAFLTIGGRSPTSDTTLASSAGRGDLLVTGAGSRLLMTGGGNGNGITVGNFGGTATTASFTVDKGGFAETTFLSLGTNGTTGTGFVDGAGSLLRLSGVGRAGEAPGGTIGRDGGTGALIVRNSGTLAIDASAATQTGGGFTIGRDGGAGTVTIETGGTMSIAGSSVGGMGLTAGRGAGGSGTIIVRSGGVLHIETPDGPALSGSGLTLGRDTGSTGTMVIDNGTVTLDINHDRSSAFRTAVQVGRGGTGSLDIANGGTLTVDAKDILTTIVSVGGIYNADPAARFSGTGRLSITGPGSKLIMTGDDANLEVGHWGAASRGDMLVATGAAVATNTLRIGVGRDGLNGATGRVELTGVGTTLALSGRDVDNDGGQIWVGRDGGTGELIVRNGARITLDGSAATTGNAFINIGGRAPAGTPGTSSAVIGSSATGDVTITGAGTRVDFVGAGGVAGGGGAISVGRWGMDTNATMSITDGAAVTTSFVTVGRGDGPGEGSRGTLVVDNASLTLTGTSAAGSGAFLSVGRDDNGRGTLRIDNGGRVTIETSSGVAATSTAGASIGRSAGSTGLLLLDRGAGLDAAGFLGIGAHFTGGAVVEGGTGTMTLSRGSVARADTIHVGALGRIDVGGSRLVAEDIVLRGGTGLGNSRLVLADGIVEAATLEAFSGAGILGTGTLAVGTVTLHDGAIIGPGFSPGTLRITGDLIAEAGARMLLDFVENPDGTITRDIIEVAGLLNSLADIDILLGGTATFDDVVGTSLSMFLVDETGAGLGHSHDGRKITVIGAGGTERRYAIIDSLLVADAAPSDVPEPGTLALLLLGGSALAWGRRRRT